MIVILILIIFVGCLTETNPETLNECLMVDHLLVCGISQTAVMSRTGLCFENTPTIT